MPCGKEEVINYSEPEQVVSNLIKRVLSKTWFGFAEVDIEVPKILYKEV